MTTARRVTLDSILRHVEAASAADRMLWRDSVAFFGVDAVDAMGGWIGEGRHPSFAARVLQQMAKPGQAQAVEVKGKKEPGLASRFRTT